jgi:hypothetical protein
MAHTRSAHYAILGYLYQFTKTLLELLKSEDGTVITVEGIEDIDILSNNDFTALQCKYHGAAEAFTESAIYKPLLQMLASFKQNQSVPSSYILYAHFPGLVAADTDKITKSVVQAALDSKDKSLVSLIEKLTPHPDIDAFLTRFSFVPGESWEQLETKAIHALEDCGLSKDDVEAIFHPWAIHRIASLASRPDESERHVERSQFLHELHSTKTATISRWTLALSAESKILKRRREQLKSNLNMNSRSRNFLISQSSVNDFEVGIVNFIETYLAKYRNKLLHIVPPIFALNCNSSSFFQICERLTNKGVRYETGYIGNIFNASRFFTPAVSKHLRGQYETSMHLRLLHYDTAPELLINPKSQDLFLIGSEAPIAGDLQDIVIEELNVPSLNQAAYLLRMADSYE